MYSDISMRIMAASSSNMNWARVLASSVFPTPVGPRNMKLAMGRLGSARPARLRLMASATTRMPSSCPMTRRCSSSSRFKSFCLSDLSIFVTGMPVHLLTTFATSSGVTTSFTIGFPSADACASVRAANSFCSVASVPYRSSPTRCRSYSRSAFWMSTFTRSISSFSICTRSILAFSCVHRPSSSACLAFSTFSSRSRFSIAFSAPSSRAKLIFSISSWRISRSRASSSTGFVVTCIFSSAAASSTRSMALSGRNRCVMYRSDSVAAWMRAASVIRTPWYSS
mmetsp:Transcript_69318/g.122393  ORF Transcript_69318/g.122393 Transcript_69318/m.122393 type:complete len:282 (+) Transcript_69318:3928-4773(+)